MPPKYSPLPHKQSWKTRLMRSGLLTVLFITIGLVFIVLIYRERGRGPLHQLTSAKQPLRGNLFSPRPGGQSALHLSRLEIQNGAAPEFLALTALPGIGMDVSQLRVAIPMHPERELLTAASLEDLEALAGKAIGGKNWGTLKSSGMEALGAPLLVWNSHKPLEEDSLTDAAVLTQNVHSAETHTMPDGGDMTATLAAPVHEEEGALPKGVEVRTAMLLSGRSVELSFSAHNMGDTVVPVRLGWMPHLSFGDDERTNVRVYVPTSDLERGKSGSAAENFAHAQGAGLPETGVDAVFTHLKHDFLSNGPEFTVTLPRSGYSVRITALSNSIRSVRVVSPAGAKWIAIVPIADSSDTVADRVAAATGEKSAHGLGPGQSMEYQLRVDVLQASTSATQ